MSLIKLIFQKDHKLANIDNHYSVSLIINFSIRIKFLLNKFHKNIKIGLEFMIHFYKN
jgi:hypothetical protein